jgi:hypothetical protein
MCVLACAREPSTFNLINYPLKEGIKMLGEGWTWRLVEGRLIEAAELWRRSPSAAVSPGRSSPFASDGPWELLTRRARAGSDWESWRREIEDAAVAAARDKGAFAASAGWMRGGLNTIEVARRDEASEWLALVPEADRLLVIAAIWHQAMTGQRVDWMRMKRAAGVSYGAEGVRKRFVRALTVVADALNSRRRLSAA